MPFDEALIRKAIVRVYDPTGGGVGTGFFVSDDGAVMTCFHIAEAFVAVRVRDALGVDHEATLDVEASSPECDIAIVATGASAPAVLPLEVEWQVGERVWACGFQFQSPSVRAAFPTTGIITGTTSIAYSGRRTYRLDDVLVVAGAQVAPGLSGAPLLLLDAGVAVAVVNTKFEQGGGFAFPFRSAIRDQGRVAAIMERNQLHVPRYGRFLNERGAAEICLRQRTTTVDRLVSTGQFLHERYCERSIAARQIGEFLAGDAKVLPIVGSAGVGKSSLLAGLARSWKHPQPLVLFSAHWLDFHQRGLRDTLIDELRQVAPDLFSDGDGLDRLLARLLTITRKRGICDRPAPSGCEGR